jgi:hypothetical protein
MRENDVFAQTKKTADFKKEYIVLSFKKIHAQIDVFAKLNQLKPVKIEKKLKNSPFKIENDAFFQAFFLNISDG